MNTTNMSNTAPRLTVAKLKAWSKKNRRLALAALKARAFAELERERVDAYILPIFAKFGFTSDETGAPLTSPSKLYLCNDDERVAAFFAECDIAHREHGYVGEAGTCPALVAEDLQRTAENALLDSLARFVGVDGFCGTLELRGKALDLAIGTCVKATGGAS